MAARSWGWAIDERLKCGWRAPCVPVTWRLESKLQVFGRLQVVQPSRKGKGKAEGTEADSPGCKSSCRRGLVEGGPPETQKQTSH